MTRFNDAYVSDEELTKWAEKRADDAGRLARELIKFRPLYLKPVPTPDGVVEAAKPIIDLVKALEGQYGFDDDKPVDTRHFGPPDNFNSFPHLTWGDLRRLVAALSHPAPTGLRMPTDPEWYARKAELEGDLEVGAGFSLTGTINPSSEERAELERLAMEALPEWARKEIETLRALSHPADGWRELSSKLGCSSFVADYYRPARCLNCGQRHDAHAAPAAKTEGE